MPKEIPPTKELKEIPLTKEIDSVDEATIAAIRSLRTAQVADYMKKRLGLINYIILDALPMWTFPEENPRVAGPAVTIQFGLIQEPELEWSFPHLAPYVKQVAVPGSVVVVGTGGTPYAFSGGNCAAQAAGRGAEGMVHDGRIRDLSEIRASGVRTFATGLTPESFVGCSEVIGLNTVIECGGAKVRPGDFILGDEDGVVVIPQESIGDVKSGLEQMAEMETIVINSLAPGTN